MTAPILIFGSTGGVGAALARQLAEAGAPVFLSSRSEDKLAQLGTDLDAPWAAADVTDPKSIADVVKQAAVNGALAGLVFAVGSIVLKPLKAARPDDFLDAFKLNTLAPAMAVKAAQKALAATGGSVVLFSTIAVQQGFSNHAIIAAAKGGVEALTRSLAAELAPKVRVNAVAPSLTDTPLAAPLTSSAAMAKAIADMHPIPRLGQPEDMAAAAAFLLGSDAAWMTGQVLSVDGGRSRLRVRG